MIGAGSSRQVLKANSCDQIALLPNVSWCASMRSEISRRPRSERVSASSTSVAVSPSKAALSSSSPLISSLILQRSSIESQLRSSRLDCSRPISPGSSPPRTSAITALRFVVDANWAKFSIQWIFQWRSWTSIASSR